MPDLRISVNVEGGDQITALARRLNEAAAGLGGELDKGMSRVVRALPETLRISAETTLPRHGGLDDDIARATITVSHRNVGGSVGVTVTASSRYDIADLDQGVVRHPLFGDRRRWYVEQVRPGWWSRPVNETSVRVEPELRQALDIVKQRIEG